MVNKSYQHLASSDAIHNYAKNIKQYKRLKDILEAHSTKTKSIEFRNELLKHQKQMNYKLELERLKGELEGQAHRLPAISRQYLHERAEKLKNAIKNNLDDIK
jgi:hypothetical protein